MAEDKAIAHAIAAEANGALSRAARAFGEANQSTVAATRERQNGQSTAPRTDFFSPANSVLSSQTISPSPPKAAAAGKR